MACCTRRICTGPIVQTPKERFGAEFREEFKGSDYDAIYLLYGSAILFLFGITPTRVYVLGINDENAVLLERRVGLALARHKSRIVWRGRPNGIAVKQSKPLWKIVIPGLKQRFSLNNSRRAGEPGSVLLSHMTFNRTNPK